MKKLINQPDDVVHEALEGVAAAHADHVRVNYDPNFVVRGRRARAGQGGARLRRRLRPRADARRLRRAWACSTRPARARSSRRPRPTRCSRPPRRSTAAPACVHIVKNYTGDIMNFEMAAELARADGIEVEAVVIDDDVAVQGQPLHRGPPRRRAPRCSPRRSSGPRPSRAGRSRRSPTSCRKVNDNARTMGMALTSCTVPAAGKPTFELGDDEMEIGIGIHGEPGRERRADGDGGRDHRDARRRRSSTICRSRRATSVLAFVNGMGGTPLIELYVVYNELRKLLRRPGRHDRAQPDRPLHHVARDGRVLDHVAQARRRAHPAAGTHR